MVIVAVKHQTPWSRRGGNNGEKAPATDKRLASSEPGLKIYHHEPQHVGAVLRAARLSRKMTLAHAAEQLHVHLSTLSRIECGRLKATAELLECASRLYPGDADRLISLINLSPESMPGLRQYLMMKYHLESVVANEAAIAVEEVVRRARRTA